jgi:hypothetical protein
MSTKSAGIGEEITAEADIFDNTIPACSRFVIGHRSTSAATYLKVNIPGLHRSGEYFPIFPGGVQEFEIPNDGISKVTCASNDGTTVATIDFGVSARGVV